MSINNNLIISKILGEEIKIIISNILSQIQISSSNSNNNNNSVKIIKMGK